MRKSEVKYFASTVLKVHLASKLPWLLATLCHLIEHLFRRPHRLDACWDAAVDGTMQYGLPDLEFGKAVVPRSTDVSGQLRSAVEKP